MMYTKSISYIYISPNQGFVIFASLPNPPPKSGTDVKMNIKGKPKDCYFENGMVEFNRTSDAPKEDTKSLYLTYEV